jgi:hypothetical protein
MGSFAETSIVDYHFLYADQGKQTLVFHFHFQQTNRSLPFTLFSIDRKQTEVAIFCQFRFLFAKFQKHGDMDRGRQHYFKMERRYTLPLMPCPQSDNF